MKGEAAFIDSLRRLARHPGARGLADDAAVLDVILGKASAKGRLPMELPRSMDAVEAQKPGVSDDSADPLYPRGAGIVG
jgi:beta-glucosidase